MLMVPGSMEREKERFYARMSQNIYDFKSLDLKGLKEHLSNINIRDVKDFFSSDVDVCFKEYFGLTLLDLVVPLGNVIFTEQGRTTILSEDTCLLSEVQINMLNTAHIVEEVRLYLNKHCYIQKDLD